MEFGEGMENSDMFTQFFGEGDYFSLDQADVKCHDSLDNVLVEKFSDFDTDAEIDTNIEDVDALFDNEWMTSKIDLTSVPEQLDSSFNFDRVCNEVQPTTTTVTSVDAGIQSSSVVTALLFDKPVDTEKFDVPISINELDSDKYGPTSPEQHVPEIGAQFKVLLDSFLAAPETLTEEEYSHLDDPNKNDILIAQQSTTNKLPLKRKMSDSVPQGPTPKVKTPEQKQRKRLQNRNAATRYRSKKRNEYEDLTAKRLELEDENKKLQDMVKSKQQEVQYLKNLIIDVFSKKPCKIK